MKTLCIAYSKKHLVMIAIENFISDCVLGKGKDSHVDMHVK